MLARMDIISINCPHTPATYHLLSARRLKLMRPEAYIVNTARGEVIDENALVKLITDGEIAGAGLDVFEHEPAVIAEAGAARARRQGGAAAALGSATLEGRVDMGERVIVNIRTFLDGHKPPDRVLPSMLVHAMPRSTRDVSLCTVCCHLRLACTAHASGSEPNQHEQRDVALIGRTRTRRSCRSIRTARPNRHR